MSASNIVCSPRDARSLPAPPNPPISAERCSACRSRFSETAVVLGAPGKKQVVHRVQVLQLRTRGPRFFWRRGRFAVRARLLQGLAQFWIRILRHAQMFRLSLSCAIRIRLSVICRGAPVRHLRGCFIAKIHRQLSACPRRAALRDRVARLAFASRRPALRAACVSSPTIS